jgi:hypothetical protein
MRHIPSAMMGLDHESTYRRQELHAAMANGRLPRAPRNRTLGIDALRGKAGVALIALGERLQPRPSVQPQDAPAQA